MRTLTDEEWIAQKRAEGFQIDDPLRRRAGAGENIGKTVKTAPKEAILAPSKKGRGVRREPGQMNGLEKKYARRLDQLKADGEIVGWWFEGIKLRLAPATFYTPDFLVMLADCTLELHECKGFVEDDSAVKVKVAAAMFPFVFRMAKFASKTGWRIHEVTGKLKS